LVGDTDREWDLGWTRHLVDVVVRLFLAVAPDRDANQPYSTRLEVRLLMPFSGLQSLQCRVDPVLLMQVKLC
jgi:hypothetical protein